MADVGIEAGALNFPTPSPQKNKIKKAPKSLNNSANCSSEIETFSFTAFRHQQDLAKSWGPIAPHTGEVGVPMSPAPPEAPCGQDISTHPSQGLAQLSAHSRQALRIPNQAHELLAKGPGAEDSLRPYRKILLLFKCLTSKFSSWRPASCLPRWERGSMTRDYS